ncbi:hypothetical protein [Novosphingobium sp. PhB165]|uniref:hypothetical protein n=1 Tax=Novosphingobium sp. PhB165 TaxID=2485105 RepID=UPI001050D10A|nr:hypothetical protein [Novosphingobium sp. PhB165]
MAAPSQKAALAAWGADSNLFLQGMAEKVDDPAFMNAPLADPGKVIKVPRGSPQEHLLALTQTAAPKANAGSKKPPGASSPRTSGRPSAIHRKRPTPPRPSRAALDAFEAELERHDQALAEELAELEAERKRIADEIAERRETAGKARARLSSRLEKARSTHEAAMERWRKDA